MIFDYIMTFFLSITVNVFITKPLANLLDLFFKRNTKELLDDNNNFKVQSNGKPGAEDSQSNDIIVLTNVAIDGTQVIMDDQLKTDTFINNLEKDNLNVSDKEVSVKLQ